MKILGLMFTGVLDPEGFSEIKLPIVMFGIVSASVIDRSHPSNSGPTQVTWKIFLIYNVRFFPGGGTIALHIWIYPFTMIARKLMPSMQCDLCSSNMEGISQILNITLGMGWVGVGVDCGTQKKRMFLH